MQQIRDVSGVKKKQKVKKEVKNEKTKNDGS